MLPLSRRRETVIDDVAHVHQRLHVTRIALATRLVRLAARRALARHVGEALFDQIGLELRRLELDEHACAVRDNEELTLAEPIEGDHRPRALLRGAEEVDGAIARPYEELREFCALEHLLLVRGGGFADV